jgi:potassium/chloride transporter 9
LNTVPAWKKAYKLRVAVFVEYESDVEEEKGRVKSLLENLRIEAEVLVFWLASGNLETYEIIVNGFSHDEQAENEVEECLKDQEWWEEIQKIRGNRGPTSGTEDLAEIASVFTSGSIWPESSFQQGPRGEKVERFLGLRKLLKKSKRRHTMSGITKLGVSLGMRTHRLSTDVVNHHQSFGSASEDSGSDIEVVSDSSAGESSNEDERESAASEGDLDDFESDTDSSRSIAKLKRRRSHGDSMRGPPPSKKSTGEKEIKVPERTPRKTSEASKSTSDPSADPLSFKRSESPTRKPASVSTLSTSLKAKTETPSKASSVNEADTKSSKKGEPSSKPSSVRESDTKSPHKTSKTASIRSERPTLSQHASQPKFSSKPVPMTRVATEDGPGPSIMFSDSPPPPPRRSRLPSAYQSTDRISELAEDSPTNSRRGSLYSTQALPISFNDLPCRAQHLILNELMRSISDETAVMFTTLPSPVEGTGRSEEASVRYLGDLEVLCRGCPPVLLVHSNSMTVTMSL